MGFEVIGRVLAGLVFVMALIGLAGMLLKHYGGVATKVKKKKFARLKLIEVLPLDQKNRLALVQRDDSQILVSISNDRGVRLLETGIEPSELDGLEEADNDDAECSKSLEEISEEVARATDA